MPHPLRAESEGGTVGPALGSHYFSGFITELWESRCRSKSDERVIRLFGQGRSYWRRFSCFLKTDEGWNFKDSNGATDTKGPFFRFFGPTI